MRFQILGPIRVEAAGREVTITASRDRILLGMLLLYANQPVTSDQLIDAIWPANPPQNARNQLQGCVSRLRKRLSNAGIAGQVIVTEPTGYRVVVVPDDLDLLAFRRLVVEARAAAGGGRHDEARAGFRAALALWRGPALAGITPLAAGLEEERAQALEECLDIELTAGAGSELVAELTELVRQHPHREGLHRMLMLALYRAGRQADALAAFRHARQLLHDELGIEPGNELRQLHQAILNRDPALDVVSPVAATPLLVPRQLPSDVAGFTGRAEALKALDELLDRRPDVTGPVVISAIAGTAGVGKTALAVHWAHTVADQFPDGQLFVDLHGYTQGVEPAEPAEVLDQMLRALGVPGPQIPASLDERSALYRTRLADQQMLIVLDNAATETQVAPLIPGAPGCLVLVTSRRRLVGLDPIHTLSLDVLPTPDAVTLLTRTAGEHRLAGQPPELLTELVELCGRLPLAIRIAAARLHSHPTWPLDHLVQRLRDQQHRLGELTAGHRSITAALDLSYQHLSAEQQQTYRLLGLHPGVEFDAHATAALLDSPLLPASRVLDQLLEAHLLQEPTPGRYRFHDLTRAHAAHTATGDHTALTVEAALRRVSSFLRRVG